MTLLEAIIERDELFVKKSAITILVERLTNQLDNMERESDLLLKAGDVDRICESYSISIQKALIDKLQDARRKLIKEGCPLNYFA